MLHAFVDESESKTDFYFLSALILDSEGLSLLNDRLATLLAVETVKGNLNGVEELHGFEMMQQKGDWKGVPFRLAASIYRQALEQIDECASALYIEIIDRNNLERKYSQPYDPRDLAISFILERINEFCEKHDDIAEVYLDEHHTAEEARKNFLRYQSSGTFGYRKSKLDRIKSFEFYDSRQHWGLQAADLCTYMANRQISRPSSNPKVVKLQNLLWRQIGSILDAGRLRVWPQKQR